jgi:hypothetical protein
VQIEPYRALWAAVVLEARDDIAAEPIGSVRYSEAVSFFTGGGEWAQSRADIAGMVELHGDDLRRCGERWIRARRLKEGLPEVEPPPMPAPARVPASKRYVLAEPPPRKQALEVANDTGRKPRGIKSHGKAWKFNPFNPLLRAKK